MTHPLDPHVGKSVLLECELLSVDRNLDGSVTSVTVYHDSRELIVQPDAVKPVLDPDLFLELLWPEIRCIEEMDRQDLSEAIHELFETLASNHVEEDDESN